ncbi:hypothetical protein ACH492_28155 [Streptomyces sp. NPDC019443]|uniref:hypothetical protein n=1 Tax=Streptomyces sp. NPDC019443 TaxID=3365061 RepID=UPI003794BB57
MSRTTASHFDVFISRHGTVMLDGEPVPADAAGQTVYSAVLDALQRRALTLGAPVGATILDRLNGRATRVEVAPDGSSRLLDEVTPAADDEAALVADEAGAPLADTMGVRGGPRHRPRPHAGARPPAADTTSGRAVPAPVPGEFAEPVARINEAVSSGELERAAGLAAALRRRIARARGAEHPYALEALAMQAYIAHLCGDHSLCADLSLELAGARCRLGDPRAREDLTRATAAWRRLDNDREAVEQGFRLLALWKRLVERGCTTVADVELFRLVERHLDALGDV